MRDLLKAEKPGPRKNGEMERRRKSVIGSKCHVIPSTNSDSMLIRASINQSPASILLHQKLLYGQLLIDLHPFQVLLGLKVYLTYYYSSHQKHNSPHQPANPHHILAAQDRYSIQNIAIQPPSPSLLAQIRAAQTLPEQIASLKALKNDIIGHQQKKEIWVGLGLIVPVVRILNANKPSTKKNGKGPRGSSYATQSLSLEEQVRLQAISIVGSLAHGEQVHGFLSENYG